MSHKTEALPPPLSRCRYCGRTHHYDLACPFCSDLQRAMVDIERKYPGTGLQHQNLVKFAAHLAAGLHQGYIQAHGRGGFDPTQTEMNTAAQWALEQFLDTGYVMRDEPNGSMTEVNK